MTFAIKHRNLPPPLMELISIHFFNPLFSFAIESYLMKRILHLVSVKVIILIFAYNRFKIYNYFYIQPYSWSPQLLYV